MLATTSFPTLGTQLKKVAVYPEKIIQFGTGVLLRGLVDYAIQKANDEGSFGGSIVQVKSTQQGSTSVFTQQNQQYTVAIRGLQHGRPVEFYQHNSSIGRTLDANTEWVSFLALAQIPSIEIIISNTTEIGIAYDVRDEQNHSPVPYSFPAKLLALLRERFATEPNGNARGFIIIATELVSNNGDLLKKFVLQLAHARNESAGFIGWIESQNTFCNSLVDRIVPGKPGAEKLAQHWQMLGYKDELLIEAEPYCLWAIEGQQFVAQKLGFALPGNGVVVATDIEQYKERKLRLLNGTHSFLCGLAQQQHFVLVRESFAHSGFRQFAQRLMTEIASTLPYDAAELSAYASEVADRFANPYIDHKWLSITLNYTQKMRVRNLPTIHRYLTIHHTVPAAMVQGFVGYLRFMQRIQKGPSENSFVVPDPHGYPITDPDAATIYSLATGTVPYVTAMLGSTQLWGENLLITMPAFAEAVQAAYPTDNP